MPILNLHEFTFQMLLLPSWLTVMCIVQYQLLYYNKMKRIIMASFMSLVMFISLLSLLGNISEGPKYVVNHPAFVALALMVKEELSDVDDTASGTDWLMLNSQQYLMHCLQHHKKHHTVVSPFMLWETYFTCVLGLSVPYLYFVQSFTTTVK